MHKVFLIAMLLGGLLLSVPKGSVGAGQEPSGAVAPTAPDGSFKVTITTGGGINGPVKSQYKVGEDIPISITLTNTTDKPLPYCRSTSLFQNRPQLEKDGQPVPYATKLHKQADKEEFIQRCETSPVRQFYVIQPKESRIVDWFTLSFGSVNWYGALPAGRYDLSLQRRFVCCQGPFVGSDKITFEVVP